MKTIIIVSSLLLASTVLAEEYLTQVEVVEQPGFISRLLSGFNWTWDREAVKTGIFKNENIMIGVGQNLFNFVFSTLAWFTVSQIYSLTAELQTGRSMRSLTLSEAADQVMEAMMKYESR